MSDAIQVALDEHSTTLLEAIQCKKRSEGQTRRESSKRALIAALIQEEHKTLFGE